MLIKSGKFSGLFKTVGGKFNQNPPLATPIISEKSTLVQVRKNSKRISAWQNGNGGVGHARVPEFKSRAFF